MLQGKFPFNTRKNIKNLLQQLAKRDVHSTEVKINQVITRQKTSYRTARQMINKTQKNSGRNNKDREQSLTLNPGKQNISQRSQQLERTTTDFSLNIPSKTRVSLTKRTVVDRERYHLSTRRKQMTTDLPAIIEKITKKPSIEERSSNLRRTQGDCGELEVIKEERISRRPQVMATTFFKPQKKHVWAPSCPIQ